MLKDIRKVTDKILYVAIIILFLSMFSVTTMNVIMRYIFNKPIIFAVELARYCFAAIVYLGSIFVMRDDGHIGLDIIVDMMPKAVGSIVKKFSRVLVLAYMALFCFEAFRMVMGNWGNRSSTMGVPMSVIYTVMVIGSAGIFIEELLLLLGYKSESTASAEEQGGGM